MNRPSDKQIGGKHYGNMAIEPVEFAMKNNLDFCQSSIIKYVCRFRDKNGIEDLKKAKHYIDILINSEYPDSEDKEFIMEPIVITRENNFSGFVVRQGDRYAKLAFEEMLSVVIALAMQGCDVMPDRYLGWMLTKEQHDEMFKGVHNYNPIIESQEDESKSTENTFRGPIAF